MKQLALRTAKAFMAIYRAPPTSKIMVDLEAAVELAAVVVLVASLPMRRDDPSTIAGTE